MPQHQTDIYCVYRNFNPAHLRNLKKIFLSVRKWTAEKLKIFENENKQIHLSKSAVRDGGLRRDINRKSSGEIKKASRKEKPLTNKKNKSGEEKTNEKQYEDSKR